jgi:c-di-GMP-related signal transduction protein
MVELGRDVFVHRSPILDSRKIISAYRLSFLMVPPCADNSTVAKPDLQHLTSILESIDPGMIAGDRAALVKVDDPLGDLRISERWKTRIILDVPFSNMQRGNGDSSESRGDDKPRLCINDFFVLENVIPLLPFPCHLKLDPHSLSAAELLKTMSALKGLPVVTVATAVDTPERFEACVRAGFDLFEGEFFAKPAVLGQKAISPNHLLLLELSARTSREEDVDAIEAIFKKNPDLSFGLLNLVNSAFFRVSEHITSIRQAIALLGYQNIHKWVALMLFTVDHSDPSSNPLFDRALSRARTMEFAAAGASDKVQGDAAYMTGIFSLVPTLFGLSLEKILEKVNLSDSIKDALLERSGKLGLLLDTVEELERGEYNNGGEPPAKLGISLVDLLSAQTRAILDSEVETFKAKAACAHSRPQNVFPEEVSSQRPSHDRIQKKPSLLRRILAGLGFRK